MMLDQAAHAEIAPLAAESVAVSRAGKLLAPSSWTWAVLKPVFLRSVAVVLFFNTGI